MLSRFKNSILGASAQLRTAGDAERDARNWRAAADAYREYLAREPGDFGIWVQLGNCCKEARDYDGALAAYQSAEKLKATDADLYLQLGHLSKLRKERARAIAFYEKALALNSLSPARDELAALGVGEQLPAADRPQTIYLDVTDAIHFLRDHLHLSGIQRVIAGIVESVAADPALLPMKYKLCAFQNARGWSVAVSTGAFLRILERLKHADVDRDEINGLLDLCMGGGAIAPGRGDIYLVLGAFWVTPAYPAMFAKMRASGVRTSIFVHDLIPVTHRRYSDSGTADAFARSVLRTLSVCDFVFSNSQYVADETQALARARLGREIPALATMLGEQVGAEPPARPRDARVRALAGAPFVMFVSTIEGRKNHEYLFQIWRDLVATRGDGAPTLALVGRWGWRVDAFRKLMKETEGLHGKIVVLSGISDADLAWLYANCRFTVYPSLVEGWGLPIGESLAYGKLSIASSVPAVQEIGKDFLVYIDPLNPEDGRRKIAWAIDNPDEVEKRNALIRKNFSPRKWTAVAKALGTGAQAFETAAGTPEPFAYAPPAGRILQLTEAGAGDGDAMAAMANSLICADGWDGVDLRGAFSAQPSSALHFRVEGAQDVTTIRLGLKLAMDNAPDATDLVVIDADGKSSIQIPAGAFAWRFADVRTDAAGTCDIRLQPAHAPQTGKLTKIPTLRLAAAVYCRKDDIAGRLDMMEAVTAECRFATTPDEKVPDIERVKTILAEREDYLCNLAGLDVGDDSEFVKGVFLRFLGRYVDQGGLQTHIDYLNRPGATRRQLVLDILNSEEYRIKNPPIQIG